MEMTSALKRCSISMAALHRGKKGDAPGYYKKGTNIMVLADEKSRPVSVSTASASLHEGRLVEEVIKNRASKGRPRRITADRAYDSDPLDKKLKRKAIEGSGSLPGFSTSGAVQQEMSIKQKIIKPFYCSLLPLS